MRREQEHQFEVLSPFELKNELGALAKENAHDVRQMLNAGRGNPNWVATTPREAFNAICAFALSESRRGAYGPELGGPIQKAHIAQRFERWLSEQPDTPGLQLLRDVGRMARDRFHFEPDAFVHELTQSCLGDHYPTPDRMLTHCEKLVHAYLLQEMAAGDAPPEGLRWDLFAVEGGTAAMCYVFDSLIANHVLRPGDTIALGTPIFTPYLEIPHLPDYDLKVVEVRADAREGWQYPDSEIDKLADPKIRAFFLVNPGNPTSVGMQKSSLKRLARVIKSHNPGLVLLTDDVYGTFVDGFQSMMAALPHNTIGVYSFSKYFGATGWRLGVIGLSPDNVIDETIAALPTDVRAQLDERYKTLSLEPSKMKFIDRLVADSRSVALNHTAGLSLPQQVMMALFSAFSLRDHDLGDHYKTAAKSIVRGRRERLWRGMGLPIPKDPLQACYYATLDLMRWAEAKHGPDFVRFLKQNYEPVDIVFRLAEEFSTVLLNGGGFDAPEWSVRVSLANLPDDAYDSIGDELAQVAREYVAEWRASRGED